MQRIPLLDLVGGSRDLVMEMALFISARSAQISDTATWLLTGGFMELGSTILRGIWSASAFKPFSSDFFKMDAEC